MLATVKTRKINSRILRVNLYEMGPSASLAPPKKKQKIERDRPLGYPKFQVRAVSFGRGFFLMLLGLVGNTT